MGYSTAKPESLEYKRLHNQKKYKLMTFAVEEKSRALAWIQIFQRADPGIIPVLPDFGADKATASFSYPGAMENKELGSLL